MEKVSEKVQKASTHAGSVGVDLARLEGDTCARATDVDAAGIGLPNAKKARQ